MILTLYDRYRAVLDECEKHLCDEKVILKKTHEILTFPVRKKKLGYIKLQPFIIKNVKKHKLNYGLKNENQRMKEEKFITQTLYTRYGRGQYEENPVNLSNLPKRKPY